MQPKYHSLLAAYLTCHPQRPRLLPQSPPMPRLLLGILTVTPLTAGSTLRCHKVSSARECHQTMPRNGGAPFLAVYWCLVLLLGAPLLLLELALAKTCRLPPVILYRHLCPLVAGLGAVLGLGAVIRATVDLSIMSMVSQGLVQLLVNKELTPEVVLTYSSNMKYQDLLPSSPPGDLDLQQASVVVCCALLLLSVSALGPRYQ